jgi:succinate-semialdehyde dehydrogenase / glutarate-semialdehyde dehydrogenase
MKTFVPSGVSGYGEAVAGHAARLRAAGLLREDLFIDGRWTPTAGQDRLDVTDPGTGTVIAAVACAGAGEVRAAIAAAEQARAGCAGWGQATATVRADALVRWHQLICEHAADLATLLTAEQGKPLAEARGEVAYSAAFVRFYAEEARRGYGEVIPPNGPGRRLMALRQPVGVVAAITPWNFPVLMIARKVAPALAAGCPVVLKPASETPLSALALAELSRRAGFPPGVLNVVHGDPVTVGAELTANPAVRMLTFTGSTEVGRLLMAQCAATVKRVGLELGGNAPFIVFDDADLDAAVAGAIDAKFRNAGQTCVCANRILVQAGVHDEFAARFTEFGVIGVNTGSISYEGAPFGGMKQSGLGREGGHHGLAEFLEVKYLCLIGIGDR